MKPAPIYLYAQQLFEPNIAEMYFLAEMVEERELACLVGSLERNRTVTEGSGKAVRELAVQIFLGIEQPNAPRALASLDN
jgi:hypothetical protein